MASAKELTILIGEHSVQSSMLQNFIKPDQAVLEEVMKCYMDLLTARSKDRCANLKERQFPEYPKCVLRVDKDLDSYQPDPETHKIIIPINCDQFWALLVVNFKKNAFEIFNPMSFEIDTAINEVIKKYFKSYKQFQTFRRNDIVPPYFAATPLEPKDSGIAIMQYALALVENTSLYLEYSAYARFVICEDLLYGKIIIGLNDKKL